MEDVLDRLRQRLASEGSIIMSIRVRTGASQSAIIDQLEDGSVKVDLAAAPADNKANLALIVLLAEVFDVPRSAVTIVSGATARKKLVKITYDRSS